MKWRAEIMTDPDRGHRFHIELLEGDEYRGRIQRRDDGHLELVVYGPDPVTIPLEWLQEMAVSATKDL